MSQYKEIEELEEVIAIQDFQEAVSDALQPLTPASGEPARKLSQEESGKHGETSLFFHVN